MHLLIIAATSLELAPFYKYFNKNPEKNIKITFRVLGIGAKFVQSISKLQLPTKIDLAILVGSAASTAKNIKIFNLVFPKKIYKTTAPNKMLSLPGYHLRPHILQSLSFEPKGRLLTVGHPAPPSKKSQFAKSAEYIDMESFYFADFCLQHKISYLVFKIVSDSVAMQIPEKQTFYLAKKNQWLKLLFFHPLELIFYWVFIRNLKKASQKNMRLFLSLKKILFQT